jgi:hypothetical protein
MNSDIAHLNDKCPNVSSCTFKITIVTEKVDETNATVAGERIQAKRTVPARQFANIVLVDRGMEYGPVTVSRIAGWWRCWHWGRAPFETAGKINFCWVNEDVKANLANDKGSPKSRSMTILTAENITARRVLIAGPPCQRRLQRDGMGADPERVPASFAVLDSWTLSEMIMFRGL